MNSQLGIRFGFRGLVLAVAVLIGGSLPLAGQDIDGSIFGDLKDASGGVIPGASVTVTNKSTGRTSFAKTGSDGVYYAHGLEPGHYSLIFQMRGFSEIEISDVALLLGQKLKINGSLNIAPIEQEVTVIEDSPMIDLSKPSVGHNVTSEEFDRLPKARSFQGLLLTSPSVTSGVNQYGEVVSIEGGFQVNGASASENQFFVDGVATNSQLQGQSRQNAVFEFLQEVQVKTGGLEAEYGGALGGVISAVTKSGGNRFHGEAHYYFDGSSIKAGPVLRLLNPLTNAGAFSNVQDEKQPDSRQDVGGSLGGPILKEKLWFFASAAPQWRRRSNRYSFAGGDQDTLKQNQFFQNLFSKLSYDPWQRVRANFSWLYSPTSSSGRLPNYESGPNASPLTLSAAQFNKQVGFFAPQSSYQGNVTVTLSPWAVAELRGGRFWDDYKDSGIAGVSAVQYQTPSSDLPANLLANVPLNQRGATGYQSTPRLQRTTFDLVARTFVQANISVSRSWWGDHELKFGLGTSKAVNDVDFTYPGGGYVLVFWNRSFRSLVPDAPCNIAAGCRGTYGYYEVDDRGTRGAAGSNLTNLYVQDKWNVLPRLTLSLGLRLEDEKVPSFRRDVVDPAVHFGFGDKIGPRLGASYDALGDGKLKLAISWGRYFDWVKYQFSRGSFGADIWTTKYRALDTPDVSALSGTNLPGRDLWDERTPSSFQDRRVPSFSKDCNIAHLDKCAVDPGLRPMSADVIRVLAEYQITPQTVFRASYVHDGLRRTIEDMGLLIDGNQVFKQVNPGEGIGRTMLTSGATRAPAELCREKLNGADLEACLAGKVIPTPKAVRNYDALELSLSRRFASGWFFNGSYVYSRLYGNYAGLSNSDEVRTPTTASSSTVAQQQTGNLVRPGTTTSRAYDLDETLFDSHGHFDLKGRLATDRPHQLKLYGSYGFKFGTEIGAFFYILSGTPVSTYVYTNNIIPVFVNGRGDLGRTPVLSQTDLSVSHEFKLPPLGENKKLRFEFTMLNLFNQKTARHIFNCYNFDCINGLASATMNLKNTNLFNGFDYKAEVLKSPDGAKAVDPRYRKDDLFNPGFQGRVGIKFIF